MIKNWLITGDTHGLVNSRLKNIDSQVYIPEETVVIILGDMGLNFYLNKTDAKNKKAVNDTGFHIYAVRGNHEERPERLNMNQLWDTYIKGGVYYEPEFPNIRYLMDGEEYEINGHPTLVIGGAYSVDKWFRLDGRPENTDSWTGWFKDELLTLTEMADITKYTYGCKYDFVLTHTCPRSWEPTDLFLRSVIQSSVDKTMEYWLDVFKEYIQWEVWLFGHYHADRYIKPGVEMLYTSIVDLEEIWDYELKRKEE